MSYFVDEYPRVLDEKGRLILPAKVREMLGDTVFISRAPNDKCLHIYTEEEWSKLAEKLSRLPTATDKNASAFVRMFFGKASSCVIDKQGRITIAQRLSDYAELDKNVMLVGANTRLELWNSDIWESYQEDIAEDIVIEGIMKYELNI